MDLFKNFDIGGLFQAGRRMAPPWGSFRRFTNTYKDQTNTCKPYGRGPGVLNEPNLNPENGASGFAHLGVLSSHYYLRGILQFHAMRDGVGTDRGVFSYFGPDGGMTQIMQPFKRTNESNCVEIPLHMQHLPSGNFSSCTVARKSFMSSIVDTTDFDSTKPVNGYSPQESYLMSFDGIRVRGAGLPLPWSHIPWTVPQGNFFARVVYATIGLDGELILSPYIQQQLSSAEANMYLGGYTAYPGTKKSDDIGGANGSFPHSRGPKDHLFEEEYIGFGYNFGPAGSNLRYFDKRFLKYNDIPTIGVSGELVVEIYIISPSVEVGDWLLLDAPVRDVNNVPPIEPCTLYMFKIKSIVGTTVTFYKEFKYLDEDSVTWIDADMQVRKAELDAIDPAIITGFLSAIQANGNYFSNMYMIISYSTTEDSGYRVAQILPVFWDSEERSGSVDLSQPRAFSKPWCGVISSYFADWYDITSVKTTFPPVKGITNYKELLVGFDAKAIYFNDVSLGGSTEMVGGLTNIIPFGTEYGDIVAICGSEDFLFVGRERKNYVITGDIAGSNFNITECDLAVQGPHNAKCVSNAWSGQVIFMNSSGVYSVNSAGNITDISLEIKDLFLAKTNKDQNLFDKSVFKTVLETRNTGVDGGLFKISLEDKRGFVIILSAQNSVNFNVTNSNMLVFNTNASKWYEFEGVESSSVESFFGSIMALGSYRALEDGEMRNAEKQLLVTQLLTLDQPSLEKKVCQVRLYGEIAPANGVRSLTVGQISNWLKFDGADRSNWATNAQYLPKTFEVYDHKKRLDSSKPLVTSIILESTPSGSFELEGMEIEGVISQQTVKT